ncbi:MAG: DUF4381 domain-containing protein [Pseudomonadota bacterium]
MQADPLQQLRALHLPDAPSWWPPAPGWWVVFAATLLLLAFVARALLDRRRTLAPIVRASEEHHALLNALQQQQLTPAEYLHASNALLKRVYLYALNEPDAGPLSGMAWLERLDQLAGEGFVHGPGRHLGDSRFAPLRPVDPRHGDAETWTALGRLINRTLEQAAIELRRRWLARWLPRRANAEPRLGGSA